MLLPLLQRSRLLLLLLLIWLLHWRFLHERLLTLLLGLLLLFSGSINRLRLLILLLRLALLVLPKIKFSLLDIILFVIITAVTIFFALFVILALIIILILVHVVTTVIIVLTLVIIVTLVVFITIDILFINKVSSSCRREMLLLLLGSRGKASWSLAVHTSCGWHCRRSSKCSLILVLSLGSLMFSLEFTLLLRFNCLCLAFLLLRRLHVRIVAWLARLGNSERRLGRDSWLRGIWCLSNWVASIVSRTS